MMVIAYYTEGTSYEREAELFSASLDKVRMDYHIQAVPDKGSWDENTRQKPRFIRDMRKKIRGPLVYIDVDAFVHRDCTDFFDGLTRLRIDFAAHWFAGPGKGHNFKRDNCACLSGKKCDRPHRLLSGTLFFGDTKPARQLLDVWIALNDGCAQAGWLSGGGQRNLWAVVQSQSRNLKTFDLPGRYCYVFDKAQAYPEGEPRIIEHTIASRDNRSKRKRPKDGTRSSRMKTLQGSLEKRKKFQW